MMKYLGIMWVSNHQLNFVLENLETECDLIPLLLSSLKKTICVSEAIQSTSDYCKIYFSSDLPYYK